MFDAAWLGTPSRRAFHSGRRRPVLERLGKRCRPHHCPLSQSASSQVSSFYPVPRTHGTRSRSFFLWLTPSPKWVPLSCCQKELRSHDGVRPLVETELRG